MLHGNPSVEDLSGRSHRIDLARERGGTEVDTGRRDDLMEPWPHPMPMEWWIRKSTELFHRYDLDESGSINADTEELSQLALNISWQLQQNFGVDQPSPSEIETLTANLGRFDHSRKALSLEQFQQWYLSEVLGRDAKQRRRGHRIEPTQRACSTHQDKDANARVRQQSSTKLRTRHRHEREGHFGRPRGAEHSSATTKSTYIQ